MTKKVRCGWVGENKPHYENYHDHEWGRPVHDDQKLFEMLILEGAQAGLNWETILKKRDGYRKVFNNFDVKKCAKLTDADLEKMLQDERIIRNRLKVYAVRKNALAFIEIQKEFGTFDTYLWAFTGKKQKQNKWKSLKEVPAQTDISEAISKDLKKRGMTFVGPTIIYAFMQAIGMVNDHITSCFCYKECS
ncbi:MAG: DNA-3-methyladenine glycosylase I [Pseudobdellovibrionaceae bacterium]|jgi:DNA-3-methyladenine glycosylase I|nr:DNA-3-methyladenine glycosylase I [Pseudobdellovibrionaceae bacterium]